jgi:membrane peptidoglycan carboxypeptidase
MASNNRYEGYEAYARRRRALRRRHSHYGYYGGSRGGTETLKRGFPLWAMALIGFTAFGIIVAAAAGAYALSLYDTYAGELVAPDELAINQPSYGAKIYDRNGTLLYEYIDDKAGLRRPTPLEQVAPAFLAATISTEDDSFFRNPGVNFEGLARAALENSPLSDTGEFFEGSGGSSITQQLVKNVYITEDARQERWSKEGIERKLREAVFALELTERYDKSRILEWYVNQISYGGVFNGVEAAARGYFGKPAAELTLGEAAMLAGIPQSPAAYNPIAYPEAAAARRDQVLDLMLRQSPIQIGEDEFFTVTEADVARAKQEEITIVDAQFEISEPHWVLGYIEPQLREMLGCPSRLQMRIEYQEGKREEPLGRPGEGCEPLFTEGLVVTTTIDVQLQQQVLDILRAQIPKFEAQSNIHNGSVMVMDPHNGEVLVMVGSRDYYNDDVDGSNNNAIACNSPGSSFKPFAYLATFENLGWGPGTMILDTPVRFVDDLGQVFEPSNPLKNFSGPVTIREALGNSLNIPANKAAAAVGSQAIIEEARKVGFVDTFRQDGCSAGIGYGPAIATGGVDVTLEEMVFGYSTLAAAGTMRGQEPTAPHDPDERQADPVSILRIEDNLGNVRWDIDEKRREMQVVDPGYAYLLWSILTDSKARCRTFNCGLNVSPNYPVAVKTGTSEPYDPKDPVCGGKIGETWAFGYSPDLVVGVWGGNSDNSCLVNISSATMVFDVMSETFTMLQQGREVTAFNRPENVVEAEVCVPSGMLKSSLCQKTTRDLFVKDDVPKEQDTWWKRVRVDKRNNLLATSRTPSRYVEERVMLVPPQEWLANEQGLTPEQREQRKYILEWANALNIALAPTQESDASNNDDGNNQGSSDSEVAIVNPSNGDDVKGRVQILGRASVDNFEEYRLEYGRGANPQQWNVITTSNSARQLGALGTWNTSGLAEDTYTLRLVVTDEDGEDHVASVTVQVER